MAEELQADPAFAGGTRGNLMEAGRLAEMVSATAYVQVPAGGWEQDAAEQCP